MPWTVKTLELHPELSVNAPQVGPGSLSSDSLCSKSERAHTQQHSSAEPNVSSRVLSNVFYVTELLFPRGDRRLGIYIKLFVKWCGPWCEQTSHSLFTRCGFVTPLVSPETPVKSTTLRWLFVFHRSSAFVLPPADSVTLFIVNAALCAAPGSDLAADWSSRKGSGSSDTLIGFKATGSEHTHTHTTGEARVNATHTCVCVCRRDNEFNTSFASVQKSRHFTWQISGAFLSCGVSNVIFLPSCNCLRARPCWVPH